MGLHKPTFIGSTVHCTLLIVHMRVILCHPLIIFLNIGISSIHVSINLAQKSGVKRPFEGSEPEGKSQKR